MTSPSPVDIYRASLESRELVLQQCRDCGKYLAAPADSCSGCGSSNFKWLEASGWGVVLGSSGQLISTEGRHYHQVTVKLNEGITLDAPLIGETTGPVRSQSTVLAHVAPWQGELSVIFTCQTEDDEEW